MDRSIEFYLGMSREMKSLKCSEMYIGVDDMYDIITRLRQAEKDAARYRWLRDDYRHEYCVDDLFDGSSASVDNRIDEAMQCHK